MKQTKLNNNSNLGNIMRLDQDLIVSSDDVQFGKNAFTLGDCCNVVDMEYVSAMGNRETQLLPKGHIMPNPIIWLNSASTTRSLSASNHHGLLWIGLSFIVIWCAM